MTDIEKKAFEAYPNSPGYKPDYIREQENFDQELRREGYINCAEEYESLPKIRGVVSYLFSPEIIEAAGLKSEDEVELLIRRK